MEGGAYYVVAAADEDKVVGRGFGKGGSDGFVYGGERRPTPSLPESTPLRVACGDPEEGGG